MLWRGEKSFASVRNWWFVKCPAHSLVIKLTMLPKLLLNCSYCSHVHVTHSVYMSKQSYKNKSVLISSTNPITRTDMLGNSSTNKFISYLSPAIICIWENNDKSCPASEFWRVLHIYKVKLFFSELIRWNHKYEVVQKFIYRIFSNLMRTLFTVLEG